MSRNYADPLGAFGLAPAINVSGTKTSIGASRVKSEVVHAVSAVLTEFVDIDALQAKASAVIASVTGAEAGCITDCSAAGIAQAVAATLTGSDLGAIEKLPDCGERERRVLIPMGHMINYGGPIPQLINITGADLVALGTAAQCEVYHLRHELESGAAAAVYVVSHHTVREGELPMDVFIELCREYNTPVIVDMASEYDLTTPVALGADAVVYSGHKFLSGITSGIVAGSEEMIRAVYLQHRGIGRMMKVGKEGIVGAMVALELWQDRDADAMTALESGIVDAWMEELDGVAGLQVEKHTDWTGNPITRVRLFVHSRTARLYAWELAARLATRTPAIIVRDDLAEHGELYLDPCTTTAEEAARVSAAIREELDAARSSNPGLETSWSDVKRQRELGPLAWPAI